VDPSDIAMFRPRRLDRFCVRKLSSDRSSQCATYVAYANNPQGPVLRALRRDQQKETA